MSVFVVLGLIWAAVLVPPTLRARAERRAEFIDSFQEQMGALGAKARAGQASQVPPTSRKRRRSVYNAMKRRRDILGGLLGAMIGSFFLGAIPHLRVVWALHLFLLNVFLAYVALLARQRQLAMRRRGLAVPPAAARRPAVPGVRPRKGPEPALAPVLQSTAILRH
ncbi:MAG: hypothetical protein ABR540_17735 [Acidimicrobiales bacterium]